MAEPGKVKVETITYQYGDGRNVSVNVRKNRTEAETNAQIQRIYKNYSDVNPGRVGKAMNVHAYTRRALNLTNRGSAIPNSLSATLVSRRNNRR